MQKNASIHYVAARLVSAKAEALDAWHTEPPPTFPFRKSQCQTARQTDVFTPLFNETPLSQLTSRSGVGAGYRSGLPPSQTLKSRKKRFFCACCGWTFPLLFRSNYRVRRLSIYGASRKFQRVPLILPLRKAGCSAKKPGFPGFLSLPETAKKAPGD